MSGANKNDQEFQTFLLGIAGVIITLLMSSGTWDIFDLVISFLLIGGGILYLEERNIQIGSKWLLVFLATAFAIVGTAAIIPIISAIAVVFNVSRLALVDLDTYVHFVDGAGYPLQYVYASQLLWQSGIFFFCFLLFVFYLRLRKYKPPKK